MNLFSARGPMYRVHHSLDEKPEPESFSMHAHDCLELYFFIRGKALYRVEGTEYRLRENDVLLMREAETHKLIIDPSEPYERISIHFHKELVQFADPALGLLRPFYDRPLGGQNQYHMEMLSDRFWQVCFSKLAAPPEREEDYRVRLVSYLLPILQEINTLSRGGIAGESGERETLAPRLIAYINLHLYEPLTLETLSRKFYLSRSQLNRVFSQSTGTTVARYIELKRLLAARQKIRAGEAAGRVCLDVGFYDYSNFYRAYRRQFGCAPAQDKNADNGRA